MCEIIPPFGKCLHLDTDVCAKFALTSAPQLNTSRFQESKAFSKNMETIIIREDHSQVTYLHGVTYVGRYAIDLTVQMI